MTARANITKRAHTDENEMLEFVSVTALLNFVSADCSATRTNNNRPREAGGAGELELPELSVSA
jgi:hypothetical protein